jgi:flagellin
MANSVERLSSGLRINRAKDDAAGLGIANALTQQINGANQGILNLNDGISMVQTAEGALTQASEISQRILSLSIQGANGSLSTTQQASITTEMSSLMTAVNNIETRTKFTGTTLLAGLAISIVSSNVSTDNVSLTSAALAKINGTNGTGSTLSTAIGTATTTANSANFLAITTAASAYITVLDTQRATLGALQNQMEFSVNNITELSANLTSARSRVIDTDYASETASLTKGQILQQAATAMLAQANQMPNVILTLLK